MAHKPEGLAYIVGRLVAFSCPTTRANPCSEWWGASGGWHAPASRQGTSSRGDARGFTWDPPLHIVFLTLPRNKKGYSLPQPKAFLYWQHSTLFV